MPEVRSVVHFMADASSGERRLSGRLVCAGKIGVAYYPNRQDAAALWYHDHAMGINRLNIYAGLLGMYIVRDNGEEALNLAVGKYEIPLVICDRLFDKDGQLFYPVSRWPARRGCRKYSAMRTW